MANYQHKRSQVAGKVPLAGDLLEGEVAVNIKDRKLFSKDDQGVVFEFLGGNSGGVETVNGISPVSGNVTLNALNIPPTADRLWLTQAERQLIAGFDAYDKTESDDRYLLEANNLSDLTNAATARTNLGLGTAATRDVATVPTIDNSLVSTVRSVPVPSNTHGRLFSEFTAINNDAARWNSVSNCNLLAINDNNAMAFLLGSVLNNRVGGVQVGHASGDFASALGTLDLNPLGGPVLVNGNTAYHTGNIIGTVSQSGGVPTGAIIESGSNVNGEYVRYADGTMICKYLGDTNTSAVYPQTHSWNIFPSTFQDNPTILCQGISWRGGDIINYHYTDVRMAGRGDFSSGVAVCQVFTTSRDGGNPTNATRIMWQAIGRWF